MKKGFTIVEVSILFVIFLIVAFLVAPLSLDDTMQAKNTSRWRSVQQDFLNIFYSMNTKQEEGTSLSFEDTVLKMFENEVKEECDYYKIIFMNGTYPNKTYQFEDYKTTLSNATIAIKVFKEPEDNVLGILMYDVNGKKGPNTWGKDVFGLNIFNNKFEPFGKNEPISEQKQDCSKNGTGLSCSNFYLIGGSFD